MKQTKLIMHVYKAAKHNRNDVQYQIQGDLPQQSWLTERVKCENYLGFSKAYNIAEYFRLRGNTSWKSGEQVTGLFKTSIPNWFYGDRRTTEGRTLILFSRTPDFENLTVYTVQSGYYPTKNVMYQIINRLKP